MITIDEFQKVDMRVGTIIDASENQKAKKKAYKLTIDFGSEIGIKKSSAQITDVYKVKDLIGKQIIAVINFPPIKIGDIKSEVLVLGADSEKGVILLSIDKKVANGKRVY